MALRLQFLTVIVPRSAFPRCRELPELLRGLDPGGGFRLDTCWFDTHLWCETAMDGDFADFLLDRWKEAGLRWKTPDGAWADVCLAAAARGPLGPCPWLEYDPDADAVWLRGTEPGRIIGGQAQLQGLGAELAAAEAEAEAAYTRMYDARRPKDEYEAAREALGRGLSLARFLGDPEAADRLAARLEHIGEVYRSQFRGW